MNLSACPDCGNACSLTSTTCPHCGRIMKPDDLSQFNSIKRVNHSKILIILAYVLAFISGLTVNAVVRFVDDLLGIPSMLPAAVIHLLLGALFGFVWSNVGWKWGLWLVALPNIIWLVIFTFMWNNPFLIYFPFLIQILPSLVSSCVGAYIGAKYKQKQHTGTGDV